MRSDIEKEALKKIIETKLRDKTGNLAVTVTDEKFLSNLLDVCTLNQLRDAVNPNPLKKG
jgi:hypothetical protein